MTQNTQSTKKVISRSEFDKRVDIERAYCEYMEYMSTPEAREEALKRISKEYKPKSLS